jgi:hypothetical protein
MSSLRSMDGLTGFCVGLSSMTRYISPFNRPGSITNSYSPSMSLIARNLETLSYSDMKMYQMVTYRIG